MLVHGYNNGLPADAEIAWGCRAIVHPGGVIDIPLDRKSLHGPRRKAIAFARDKLAPRMEPMRERIKGLFAAGKISGGRREHHSIIVDAEVTIVANTNGSHGHLYLAAYPTPKEPSTARQSAA